MFHWLKKKLGYHVCENFSQWEELVFDVERPATYRDGNVYLSGQATFTYTEYYQRRKCLDCGKVFRERM